MTIRPKDIEHARRAARAYTREQVRAERAPNYDDCRQNVEIELRILGYCAADEDVRQVISEAVRAAAKEIGPQVRRMNREVARRIQNEVQTRR